MERAEVLIDRIADERQSVDRGLIHEAAPAPARDTGMGPVRFRPSDTRLTRHGILTRPQSAAVAFFVSHHNLRPELSRCR